MCINTAMVWMAKHVQKNMKTAAKQGYWIYMIFMIQD